MDTISHGLWAFFLFRNKKGMLLFILGAVYVDLPYFIGAVYHFIVKPGFGVAAYFDMIHIPFVRYSGEFFHSVVIWSAGFVLVYYLKRDFLPFIWGWLLHIAIDILTHHSDTLPYFWPLSNKEYPGLLSYWEPQYHGIEFLLTDLTFLLAVLFITLLIPRKNKN